ncbi:diguanylate cyclase [Rhizobiaceae bacterium n13]|uniref:Diguanylate cyclase n=1 Tax=Ferirhizobium litorale TaxID=2927786 RepID=A0AAE3QDZ4_9HYPH|nr:diguanylate cyclase [Fererhizobium litorale]MDI7861475.1 diguanylate cyclase [Fererhizobium litorale]MDI7921621.1 diguanylate cyclase [Fererhizobium litorale]
MQQVKNSASSIAFRVATAMHQMGIDGLPRNYELVYEVYSGNNPELVREFVALGRIKNQEALDEIGRKYLPHHHEEGLLKQQSGRVRSEMNSFMSLLSDERSSLGDYSRIIGEASRTIMAEGPVSTSALSQSINALKAATEKQVNHNSTLSGRVAAHTKALAEVQRDAEQVETAKFTDVQTGLGNRRAFNKALAKVYANAILPVSCGIVLAEIDDMQRFADPAAAPVLDQYVRQASKIVSAVVGTEGEDQAFRLDGGRLAMLFYAGDEAEISRMVDVVRSRLRLTNVIHPTTARALGPASMSYGICMSRQAGNGFDLVSYAERALGSSKAAGSDSVTIYGTVEQGHVPKDWLIYRP